MRIKRTRKGPVGVQVVRYPLQTRAQIEDGLFVAVKLRVGLTPHQEELRMEVSLRTVTKTSIAVSFRPTIVFPAQGVHGTLVVGFRVGTVGLQSLLHIEEESVHTVHGVPGPGTCGIGVCGRAKGYGLIEAVQGLLISFHHHQAVALGDQSVHILRRERK
ncbi:MAG: hypothetical protein IPK99_01700 [Flavobacteriales bacterium]|nr:hypothetical protein [Flavobacteriales bacterium]